MSKRNSKTQNQSQSLDVIKQLITRDIQIGSEHDSLSPTTINLYVRQILKLYKAGVSKNQWDYKEFINALQYPARYDDTEFQKIFKVHGCSASKSTQAKRV